MLLVFILILLVWIILQVISSGKGQNGSLPGTLARTIQALRMLRPKDKDTTIKTMKRKEIEEQLDDSTWQRQSYNAFVAVIASERPITFPCIYATKGFKAREHRYVFLESEDTRDPGNIFALSTILQEYLNTPSSDLGPNTSLVVLFPIPRSPLSVEEYHCTYRDCLYSLRKVDPRPWPENIPSDTDTALWRFCFNGGPVFTAALTLAHRKRQSRYAPCLCIVFQSDFVFDALFATQLKRQMAVSEVRGLLADFDRIPISPD